MNPHQKNQTDQPSLEALKAGDREAFAKLVDMYSPMIYRLAYRMLGDAHEAEDVLQETFMNAYRHLDTFEGRSSLKTWLYRIGANQALMRLRKRTPTLVSVDEEWQTDDGTTMARELEDWCCLPEDEFMTSEVHKQLELASSQLSSALNAVFTLRDLHGMSTRETAEILDISESAVKTRLLRARLQLRELLSEYFAERVEERFGD